MLVLQIQHLCYYCCHVIIISTHEHINILVIEEYKFQLWVVMYINVINDVYIDLPIRLLAHVVKITLVVYYILCIDFFIV